MTTIQTIQDLNGKRLTRMNEPRGYLGRCTVPTDAATAEQNTQTMSHWSSSGRAVCNIERSSHQRRSRHTPIVNQNRRVEPLHRYG